MMKKNRIVLSISLLLAAIPISAVANEHTTGTNITQNQIAFPDVSEAHWGFGIIRWGVDNKIVEGYPDGTFKPDQNVTQSEFLAMLLKAYKIDLSNLTQDGPWDTSYLQYARDHNWALVEFTYRPIFRGQVAKLLANGAGKNYAVSDSIHYLLDAQLSNGKTDRSIAGYKANDLLTRTEAVAFIKNVKSQLNLLAPAPIIEEKYNYPNSDIAPQSAGRMVSLQELQQSNKWMKIGYRKQLQAFEVKQKTYQPSINDLSGNPPYVTDFLLNGNYQTLNARIAVDDNYKYDAMRFTVYADKDHRKQLYMGMVVRGEEPKMVELNLDGVNSLQMGSEILVKEGDNYKPVYIAISGTIATASSDESVHIFDVTLTEVAKK
jgi:hypothetical protein